MFQIQNWKAKLAYAGFGCLFGSFCTIIGMLASPVTAQRDKFGEIECTKLTVVDERGNARIELGTHEIPETGEDSAHVYVYGKDGELRIGLVVVEELANVFVKGDGGLASVTATDSAGFVRIAGKGTIDGAVISGDEHGGRVQVWSKRSLKPVVSIGNNVNGGWIEVAGHFDPVANKVEQFYGKVGVSQAAYIGIDQYGGFVNVKGRSKGYAIMGINEYGNGAVSTWDKNGYRQ